MHTKKQTIVYFDGLNLHHQLAETHPHLMWLDLVRLAKIMLGKHNTISQVKYYGARFSPSKKARLQKTYLDALESQAPKITTHFGEFKQKIRRVKLANAKANALPEFADALITEEKKTDVNLAVHLVRDAFLKRFEAAAIVTNDTDFVEAIRIVTEELKLPVGILSPRGLISRETQEEAKLHKGLPPKRMWIHDDLREVATFHKHIRESHLKKAQFPQRIPGTNLIRPREWD
ncbi:MAG: NYN domain-containing protein [Proteobacteria bacterium]|nr:NYN domain-containing protein [Pseudomonadota bacterium]